MLKDFKRKISKGKAGEVKTFPDHIALALIRSGVAEKAIIKPKTNKPEMEKAIQTDIEKR